MTNNEHTESCSLKNIPINLASCTCGIRSNEIEKVVEEFQEKYMEVWARNVEPVIHVHDWLRSTLTTLAAKYEEEKAALREDFEFATEVIGHLYMKFGDNNEVVTEMKRYIAARYVDLSKTDVTPGV